MDESMGCPIFLLGGAATWHSMANSHAYKHSAYGQYVKSGTSTSAIPVKPTWMQKYVTGVPARTLVGRTAQWGELELTFLF